MLAERPARSVLCCDLSHYQGGYFGRHFAVVSQLARRFPGFGALVASLPLISLLGIIRLWRDKPDAKTMADHIQATFWYVLTSLPMFLLIPAMLRRGLPF